MKAPPTYSEWREHVESLGYAFFTGPWNPNLGGIRSTEREAGAWDDWLILAFEDDAGHGHLHAYLGTTDPSDRWLTKTDRNAAGTAILTPQQARGCWAVGPDQRGITAHQYPCFRQVAPMEYVRDNDGDTVLDLEALIASGRAESGIRGLDGHRASARNAAGEVGLYSAGCQVWRMAYDFAHALSFVTWASQWHGSRVSYTLVNEWREVGIPWV